jgi:hypothetical protein
MYKNKLTSDDSFMVFSHASQIHIFNLHGPQRVFKDRGIRTEKFRSLITKINWKNIIKLFVYYDYDAFSKYS